MKKSQNKVQYFAVHTILFIEFHQMFDGGPQGVRQQTPHHWLSMPHLSAPSAGPTLSCVILVTVCGDCFSLLVIADFIHAYVVNLLKNKKEQQYLFLFNNFFNKILIHLTYI